MVEDEAHGEEDAGWGIRIRIAASTPGFLGDGGGSVPCLTETRTGDLCTAGGTPPTVRPKMCRTAIRLAREGGAMKLCIPTAGGGGLDEQVGEHFGRVPVYTIYDTVTGQVEILSNESEHMGGVGLPAEHLAQAGVDVVVCASLGRRAIALLSESGIEVASGASGTAREAVRAWEEGNLREGAPCTRRAFHDRHA